MRHYELVTILSPMLSQDQAVEAWDQISSFITTRNGEVTQEQTWGTRRLAYAIHRGAHHFLEGNYRLTRFSAEAPFNQALETFLRLDERVLRSLLLSVDEGGPIPEPVRPVAAPAEVAPTAVAEPATGVESTEAAESTESAEAPESAESAEVEAAPGTEAPSGGGAETPAAEAVAESSDEAEEAEPAEAAVEAVPTAEAEAPAAEDTAPESGQSQA